jgi:FlaA1/EpsC-like NDP-sugar epimerase
VISPNTSTLSNLIAMIMNATLTRLLSPLVKWLLELPNSRKILLVSSVDLLVLACMSLLAYALRIGAPEIPPRDKLALYAFGPMLSVVFASGMGVYHAAARGHSPRLERLIVLSQLFVPVCWGVLLVLAGTAGFVRSVVVIYFALSIIAMVSMRRLAHMIFTADTSNASALAKRVPVLIYGVGSEGSLLASSLRSHHHYRPVAFIDTDTTLINREVAGLRVFPIDDLQTVTDRWSPQEVIICKPNLNRASRRQLFESFSDHGLKVKIAPGIDAVMGGQVSIDDIREIKIEDLLGRDPVQPDLSLMKTAIDNKVVMVTGAGGSIGSELVRQAASYGARKIVLLENNEFALFEIDREIQSKFGKARASSEVVPILESVLNGERMRDIMAEHRVDIVFHAAAYKHVHLVQQNPEAGVNNNVWGTLACAEAAEQAGVGRFILVSTDKAVRPTGVMGASKRLAELCVQALAARNKTNGKQRTIYSMVRFGNVLGSTGSVVPLFKEQIANGGPVLVTDPEVTRYFMLIPEAAQLVIQAGAMAKGGEVFVLDMGEPVKIVMLAEAMIELAGLERRTASNPDGDIEIKFIGLRDGEKLFEELQIGHDVTATEHGRIMRSNEIMIPYDQLKRELQQISFGKKGKAERPIGEMVLSLANRGAQP